MASDGRAPIADKNVYTYGTITFTNIGGLAASASQTFQIKIPHNLGYVPAYDAYVQTVNSQTGGYSGWFPGTFYVGMNDTKSFGVQYAGGTVNYVYGIGIDAQKIYVFLTITNFDSIPHDVASGTLKFYIYSSAATT